ncbi:hypothetical protein NDCJBJIB_02825 [Mannheimia haemolytica]
MQQGGGMEMIFILIIFGAILFYDLSSSGKTPKTTT